jgi:hypothetical protein
MVNWPVSENEISQLKRILEAEHTRAKDVLLNSTDDRRREVADNKLKDAGRLLKSLEQATVEKADHLCYCDTNYRFEEKRLHIAFRIGSSPVQHSIVEDMPPPPDEYYGILAVLQELQTKEVKGSVMVLTDAARCAIALQKGLLYVVPKHTENQAPRMRDYNHLYDMAVAITKELDKQGCHVEFRYKNRVFINSVLGLK